MQEATRGGAAAEARGCAAALDSLRGLNRRFLDLWSAAATQPAAEPVFGAPAQLAQRVAALGAEGRRALARCPYALFDLNFGDERHWCFTHRAVDRWRVEDALRPGVEVQEFARIGLFYAWHLARCRPLLVPLVFGANRELVETLRLARLDRLERAFVSHGACLSVRWADARFFWAAVTSAAREPSSSRFRRAVSLGLQVAAAHLSN